MEYTEDLLLSQYDIATCKCPLCDRVPDKSTDARGVPVLYCYYCELYLHIFWEWSLVSGVRIFFKLGLRDGEPLSSPLSSDEDIVGPVTETPQDEPQFSAFNAATPEVNIGVPPLRDEVPESDPLNINTPEIEPNSVDVNTPESEAGDVNTPETDREKIRRLGRTHSLREIREETGFSLGKIRYHLKDS